METEMCDKCPYYEDGAYSAECNWCPERKKGKEKNESFLKLSHEWSYKRRMP